MTKRRRPGDAFGELQRRAGEVLAKQLATGDNQAAWAELRAIDSAMWPAIQEALRQCGGNGDGQGSGKLHPAVARVLFDTIQAGLAGKLPPSWPEPTGHRTAFRDDAKPQAVAALYKAAVAHGLIDDPRSTQTIAKLFGVTDRMPPVWCEKHPVTIVTDAAGGVVLSCAGLTIHDKPHGGLWLGDLLHRRLELAATEFRKNNGKTNG